MFDNRPVETLGLAILLRGVMGCQVSNSPLPLKEGRELLTEKLTPTITLQLLHGHHTTLGLGPGNVCTVTSEGVAFTGHEHHNSFIGMIIEEEDVVFLPCESLDRHFAPDIGMNLHAI